MKDPFPALAGRAAAVIQSMLIEPDNLAIQKMGAEWIQDYNAAIAAIKALGSAAAVPDFRAWACNCNQTGVAHDGAGPRHQWLHGDRTAADIRQLAWGQLEW